MTRIGIALLVCFVLSCHGFGEETEEAPKRKVMLLYSSVGGGHISAARAIEARILAENPNVEFVYQDMNEFMPERSLTKPFAISKETNEKVWWYVVKNHPDLFSDMYKGFMEGGGKVDSLTKLKAWYERPRVVDFVEGQKPDVIISTVYSGAQEIADIREQTGKFRDIPVGWLNTDYVEGYFPRLSKRIDMSFLPHSALEEAWVGPREVDPKKVVTTGMPLNPKLFEPSDREAFLESKKIDPKRKVITVTGGAEGVGNFPLIAEKLAESITEPLHLVMVTAKNEAHYKTLMDMKKSLPSHVTMEVHGMMPQEELLNFIKASSLYVTKGGGLSPTEGFAIGGPMIILDVYGGHESENAILFEKLGLATINRDQTQIGAEAKLLLEDPERQRRMKKVQGEFRDSLTMDPVVDFALRGEVSETRTRVVRHPSKGSLEDGHRGPPSVESSRAFLGSFEKQTGGETHPADGTFGTSDFGKENGTPATGVLRAWDRLNRESPAEVEIILSYPHAGEPGKDPLNFRQEGGNPFGHFAIRIGDYVYTSNPKAKPGTEAEMLMKIPATDYFFGTRSPVKNYYWGSDIGQLYNRDALGLRVDGVTPDQVEKMLARVGEINEAWKAGRSSWELKYNCADQCAEVLKAGGIEGKTRRYTMPRDLFEDIIRVVDRRPELTSEVIGYHPHLDSKSELAGSRPPLSIYRPLDTIRRLLFGDRPLEAESRINRRIVSYAGDPNFYYEAHPGAPNQEDADRLLVLGEASAQRDRLEALAHEATLSELIDGLAKSGMTEAELRRGIKALEAVAKGEDPKESEIAKSFLRRLKSQAEPLNEVVQSRNALELKQNRALLERYWTLTQALHQKTLPFLTPAQQKALKVLYANVETQAKRFLQYELSDPNQAREALEGFFGELKKFAEGVADGRAGKKIVAEAPESNLVRALKKEASTRVVKPYFSFMGPISTPQMVQASLTLNAFEQTLHEMAQGKAGEVPADAEAFKAQARLKKVGLTPGSPESELVSFFRQTPLTHSGESVAGLGRLDARERGIAPEITQVVESLGAGCRFKDLGGN